MKRMMGTVLLVVPLAFGVASCQKAHKAGNDSMSAGAARIEASTSAAMTGALSALRR